MSSWWQWYDPAKRVPGYVAPLEDGATERAGIAGMLWIGSILALLSAVVCFMFTSWTAALWLIGASLALTVISRLILPSDKPRKSQ